jgi:hypothetical protein
MKYVIRDEDGEIMRVVGRQEEAKQIVGTREGWTMKCLREPKQEPALHNFEEAPF